MSKKVYVYLSQQDVQDIVNTYEKDIEKFNKQKEVLDKIKEYMRTLSDEYADDDYDIKCDVFNKIYYEILEVNNGIMDKKSR